MVNRRGVTSRVEFIKSPLNFYCPESPWRDFAPMRRAINGESPGEPFSGFPGDSRVKKWAATCSPACQGSTIGAGGLNFSVRDGMGRGGTPPLWPPECHFIVSTSGQERNANERHMTWRSFGQLVALGFDVAVFTPAPYRRRRLRRPS